MPIIAANFTTQQEARSALSDLEKHGIAPVRMNLIQPNDNKGFEREHRPTRAAALRGAVVGVIFGVAVFGLLLWIAGVYLSGIAISAALWAAVLAFWNMGVSHDEALLYEEARDKQSVIAAIEVVDPAEELVIHTLESHGARDIRSGTWQPRGWSHTHPSYVTTV
jgi:ABC-type transport system involved in cytochrome bd biosynthesis fused ATPase/permease subunit